ELHAFPCGRSALRRGQIADDGRVLPIPFRRQPIVKRAQPVGVAGHDGDHGPCREQRACDAFADFTRAAKDDGDLSRERRHGESMKCNVTSAKWEVNREPPSVNCGLISAWPTASALTCFTTSPCRSAPPAFGRWRARSCFRTATCSCSSGARSTAMSEY